MALELMPQWTQAGWICPPSGLMEPLALLTYRPFIVKIRFEEATHLPGKLPQIVPLRLLSSQAITEVFIFYQHFHKFLPWDNLQPLLCRAEGKITPGRLLQAPPPAVCHMTGDAHHLPLLLRPSLLMDTIQTWRVRTPAVESVHRWWESQFRSTCIYSSIA